MSGADTRHSNSPLQYINAQTAGGFQVRKIPIEVRLGLPQRWRGTEGGLRGDLPSTVRLTQSVGALSANATWYLSCQQSWTHFQILPCMS
jgi:hypothetical protein